MRTAITITTEDPEAVDGLLRDALDKANSVADGYPLHSAERKRWRAVGREVADAIRRSFGTV